MDAATLYVVLTLPNGEQRTSSKEFSTLRACEVQVDLRQHVPEPTGAVTTYRCAEHKTRPSIYLVACGPRAKPCEYLGPLSRRGCSAQ
jgi:hypothetical protein